MIIKPEFSPGGFSMSYSLNDKMHGATSITHLISPFYSSIPFVISLLCSKCIFPVAWMARSSLLSCLLFVILPPTIVESIYLQLGNQLICHVHDIFYSSFCEQLQKSHFDLYMSLLVSWNFSWSRLPSIIVKHFLTKVPGNGLLSY